MDKRSSIFKSTSNKSEVGKTGVGHTPPFHPLAKALLNVMNDYLHLQEMFIAELMKGAHKTALESCHKEITYGHLGE